MRNFLNTYSLHLCLLGTLLLAILYVWFGLTNTVNFPFWDQWSIHPMVLEPQPLWDMLKYQHNEHRMGIGVLIMRGLFLLFGQWNQYIEVSVVLLLGLGITAGVLWLRYSQQKTLYLRDLVIPLLLLSIFQHEIITWGIQIPYIMPIFCFMGWLYFMCLSQSRHRFAWATLLGLIGSFNGFQGVLMPLLAIGYALFMPWLSDKKASLASKGALIVFNALIILLYFWGFERNFQTQPLTGINLEVLNYFAVALGNGWFLVVHGQYLLWKIFIVGLSFAVFAWALWRAWKHRLSQREALGIAMFSFALIFALTITYARANFGVDQALASRYNIYLVFIPLGVYFMAAGKWRVTLERVVLGVVLLNYISFFGMAYTHVRSMTEARAQAAYCYKNAPTTEYDRCYATFAFFPDKDALALEWEKYREYIQ